MVSFAQADSHIWKARFHETPVSSPRPDQSRDDPPVTLQALPGGIQWKSKAIPATAVPFTSIQYIALDITSRNLAGAVLDRATDAQRGHACSIDCLAAVFLSPVFAPFRIRHHYVTVFWQSPSGLDRVTFRLGRSDAFAFARFLGAACSCPVRDFTAGPRRTPTSPRR